MRLKSTNCYQQITRRTSIQALMLLAYQGLRAGDLFGADGGGPRMASSGLSKFLAVSPGARSGHHAFFAGTHPVQGTTPFDDAVLPPPANLLLTSASPATAADVGNPSLYPTIGSKATGWDFTLTAPGGSVSAAFTGNGAIGTTPDYCVRLNRSGTTPSASLQTVAVSTNDNSLVKLLSVYLKLNLVPNNPASLCNITLTGHKAGAAVSGATKTITGIQTNVWTPFDVSSTAQFTGIDEFRFTSTPGSGVIVSSMFVDEIVLPATPLPLKLVDFSGHREGADVLLGWNTASEQHTRSFQVERATDGANFFRIGEVPAAGDSDQPLHYSFTDASLPDATATYLYRLKMIDLDGRSTYSPVLKIDAAAAGFSLTAWPNPFREQISITVTMPGSEKGLVTMSDMNGRAVLTKNIVLQKGANIIPLPLTTSLETGMYHLTLSTQDHRQTISIVKTN